MTRLCYLIPGFLLLVCNSLAHETINRPGYRLEVSGKRTLRAHAKNRKKSDSSQSYKSKGKGEKKKKKLYKEPDFSKDSTSKSKSKDSKYKSKSTYSKYKSKSSDSKHKSKGADSKNKSKSKDSKYKSEKGSLTKPKKEKKGNKKREKQPKNVTFHPTRSPSEKKPEEAEEPFPAPEPSTPRPLLTETPTTVSSQTPEPSTAVQLAPSQTTSTPSAVVTTEPPSQTPSMSKTTIPPGDSELPSAAPSPTGSGQVPLRPATAPEDPERQCSTDIDECCAKSDCASTEACANRNCIQQGCPQFTLTWTGDANLDLFVVSPSGVSLWAVEPSDSESGGVWEEGDGSGVGEYNVENVYFPVDCSTSTGIYEYFVVSGDTLVDWNLNVAVNGVMKETQSGLGGSATFQYLHVVTPGPLEPGSSGECQVSEDECCEATDCPSGSSCAERNCVVEGALRFTLTWVGSGTLLFVA